MRPDKPCAEGRADVLRATGPIIDTHVHFWDTSRGIPWPSREFRRLHRTVLPDEYKALAEPAGIIGSGVVEASDRFDDQLWVLARIDGDDFFRFYVAMLEIGADDFVKKLDRLSLDPLVVGIRSFLWAPQLKVDRRQIEHCELLAERRMTLDVISRGALNPKALLIRLAEAVPELGIIVDHLGGAKGTQPDRAWARDMRLLCRHPSVYVKFSSFFDMFNPREDEKLEWRSPENLDAYRPHFDLLMEAFGPQRLIWGSNWPVVEMGGSLERQIALAEEYLAPMGQEVRDEVMSGNALRVYSRRA